MLKFRKSQKSLSIVGRAVVFQASYRKYHAILLRTDRAGGLAKIAMWDDVLNCWRTLWVALARITSLNAKAETTLTAIPA